MTDAIRIEITPPSRVVVRGCMCWGCSRRFVPKGYEGDGSNVRWEEFDCGCGIMDDIAGGRRVKDAI